MRVSIDRVLLENNADIINYVTKGLAPSKKDFEKLLSHLSKPTDPSKNIINRDFAIDDLGLVYNNKKDNENAAIIFGGLGLILACMFGIKIGKHTALNGFEKRVDNYLQINDREHNHLKIARF